MRIAILLLLVFLMGCAAALSPTTVFTTVELAEDIAKKVNDLHKTGADQRVLDDVHEAVADAHKIVDELHQKHHIGGQKEKP